MYNSQLRFGVKHCSISQMEERAINGRIELDIYNTDFTTTLLTISLSMVEDVLFAHMEN